MSPGSEPGSHTIEFGIVVADAHQRQGIGLRSIHFLKRLARNQGVTAVHASLLASNHPMIGMLGHCGFELNPDDTDAGLIHAVWRRSDGWFDDAPASRGLHRLLSWISGI